MIGQTEITSFINIDICMSVCLGVCMFESSLYWFPLLEINRTNVDKPC